MNREIMCNEDILNKDNVGSAMLNLTDIMDDMKGLKLILAPFNENSTDGLVPHIVRSLESFISDINEVHNYLDQMCLNSVNNADSSHLEGRC